MVQQRTVNARFSSSNLDLGAIFPRGVIGNTTDSGSVILDSSSSEEAIVYYGALAELVDGTCLENKQAERLRRFEPFTLRQMKIEYALPPSGEIGIRDGL